MAHMLLARLGAELGWVMGGKRNYIMMIADLFEEMLKKALPLGKLAYFFMCSASDRLGVFPKNLGCLGTEETILSLVWYNR